MRSLHILVVLIVTIYVVNVESQPNSEQQGNTSDTKDIATINTGNPDSGQSDQANKIESNKSKQRPQRGRKLKRRQRKRRPQKKNGQMNGNGGKITAPVVPPESEQIVIESAPASVKEVSKAAVENSPAEPQSAESKAAVDILSASNVDTQSVAKAAPQVAAVVKTKPTAAPVSKDSGFDSGFGADLFFWGEETTTTAPESNAPPPDFSVIKKPRKKVMPKVDTKNSKAYDGTPCNETFKNHETNKTQYMMKYAEGVWETFDCPPNLGSGLVWRQDLCSCGEELVAQDPDDWCGQMGYRAHNNNKHKYIRYHHGENATKECAANLVWSQELCLCTYDQTPVDKPMENLVTFACKTILQMPFEGNLKNVAGGYLIKPVVLKRRGKLPRIRYGKVAGSTEKAAMIVSQPLEFLAFRGNDFQSQVTYALNFKISPRHEKKDNFMVLITDECIAGGQNRARNASIRLAFQPSTKTFQLQFSTEKVDIDHLIKGAIADSYGWYKVVIYFEDNTVNMEVNGQRVFQQKDVMGKIPQNKCPLYIAGRGQGFDRLNDFYGYLDNVSLVKDCKFHEANIKFL